MKKRNSLKIVKLSKVAKIPTKVNSMAAGFDLYSAHKYVVPAFGKALIHTDIQIALPPGTYGRIAPRSSTSWFYHTTISAGVIDYDYRGNIAIVMFNHSDTDFIVNVGDKIAQLICEKIQYPDIEEVQKLSSTIRQNKGFGSSK